MRYPFFLPAEGTFSTPGAVSSTGRPLAIGCDVVRGEMTVATYNSKKTVGSFGMEDRTEFYQNLRKEEDRLAAERASEWFRTHTPFSASVDHVSRAMEILGTKFDTRIEMDKSSEGRYIWVNQHQPLFKKQVPFKPLETFGPIKSSLITGMFQGAFHCAA